MTLERHAEPQGHAVPSALLTRVTEWLRTRWAFPWAMRTMHRRPPDKVIGAPDAPYMRRWHVLPRNRLFNVYLHQVLADDDDRSLHDHPWANVTWVLSGAYREIMPGRPALRVAGAFVARRPRARHRLELIGHEAITLFVTGPVVRSSGFWCPDGAGGEERFVPWRLFTDETGNRVGAGCGES